MNLTSAMVYITANRIASQLLDGGPSNAMPSPMLAPRLVLAIQEAQARNPRGAALVDHSGIGAVLATAETPIPPALDDEANGPDQSSHDLGCLQGLGGDLTAHVWTIAATQRLLAQQRFSQANMDADHASKVGLTSRGRHYHHATCPILFRRGRRCSRKAYQRGVSFQLTTVVLAFNAARAGTTNVQTPCNFCLARFRLPVGRLPC
jgi:hypothetical protein